jgi:hypothetical protein
VTTVSTFRVLLREGKDSSDHTLERTYRSLTPPRLEGGPYLSQEGDVFFVDEVSVEFGLVRGWRVPLRPTARGLM